MKGETNKPKVIPPPYPEIPDTTEAKKAVKINIESSKKPRLAKRAAISKFDSIYSFKFKLQSFTNSSTVKFLWRIRSIKSSV